MKTQGTRTRNALDSQESAMRVMSATSQSPNTNFTRTSLKGNPNAINQFLNMRTMLNKKRNNHDHQSVYETTFQDKKRE